MSRRLVGYAFLQERFSLAAFAPTVVARVDSVTRVCSLGEDALSVPSHVAPSSDAPLEHLLFALKHEDLNLQIAILALQRIEAKEIAAEFTSRPTGQYARLAGYLWELANRAEIPDLPESGGGYVPLFDPERFVTGAPKRSIRWRVDFNGIGSPNYCITVKRTPKLQQLFT